MSVEAPGDRGRRLEHQERAHELQLKGGVIGMIKYSVFAGLAVTFAHFTWPLFSRQTLALKGFLVSSAAVTGLTIEADRHLLRYEGQQRVDENLIRRQARNELARDGIIATETEIRKWKARKELREKEAAMLGAKEGGLGAERDGLTATKE